jgi:hypothetical protein
VNANMNAYTESESVAMRILAIYRYIAALTMFMLPPCIPCMPMPMPCIPWIVCVCVCVRKHKHQINSIYIIHYIQPVAQLQHILKLGQQRLLDIYICIHTHMGVWVCMCVCVYTACGSDILRLRQQRLLADATPERGMRYARTHI